MTEVLSIPLCCFVTYFLSCLLLFNSVFLILRSYLLYTFALLCLHSAYFYPLLLLTSDLFSLMAHIFLISVLLLVLLKSFLWTDELGSYISVLLVPRLIVIVGLYSACFSTHLCAPGTCIFVDAVYSCQVILNNR